MKTKSKEVAIPTNRIMTPADMIIAAVSGKADLGQVRELLAIQKEWEANEARKAYHKAMSEFKANPPDIKKDKKVSYLNVSFNHASLSNVVKKTTQELSKYGLSASWKTQQNGTIAVTCRITHVLGHSEETTLSANADKSGSKNDIQALGSTISYLERYSLLALLGLATSDMDDDGKASTVKVTDKELHTLRDLLIAKELSEKKLLEYLKIESLEQLPSTDYMKAITAINSAKKVGGK